MSIQKYFFSFLVFSFLLFFTSCTYYYRYPNRLQYPKVIDDKYQVLKDYEGIYLARFSGRDATRMKRLLKNSFRNQDYYEVFDRFPLDEDLTKVGLVEVDIEDVNFWEINQIPEKDGRPVNIYKEDLTKIPVVVSNLKIRVRFKIRNAKTNEIILNEQVEQSFQQYYVGRDEILNRPDADTENDRLLRLTFDRFASKLNFDVEQEYLKFEIGVNTSSVLEALGSKGDILIKKGIRIAEGENYDDALLTWMVVAYEPDSTEELSDLDDYALNRAQALYNMGQTYRFLGDWQQAARMYALANQTKKELHYAQAWADVVQIWKDSESYIASAEDNSTDIDAEKSPKYRPDINRFIFSEEQKKLEIKNKLDNRLLLSAEKLWPFSRQEGEEEQKVKEASPIQK